MISQAPKPNLITIWKIDYLLIETLVGQPYPLLHDAKENARVKQIRAAKTILDLRFIKIHL
jgi:hypothetical protein